LQNVPEKFYMDKKAKNVIRNLDNLMEFNYNFFEFYKELK